MFPFPPQPVFPKAIDSDRTLFLVYNTTESKLAVDNEAWADEIEIIPVIDDELEIWADNGFGTINGELFYYDTVEKNSNGKVFKLKRVGRNLGGERTKTNKAGTYVRSFVIAEHHNQLVKAICNVEKFVGENFTELQETLDWRIRNLEQLDLVFDDYGCPNVNFTFNIVENDSTSGILTQYLIEIVEPSEFDSFRLDFGDGEFTTTNLAGQHRYPFNFAVDPVLTITNGDCRLVLTPAERNEPSTPPSPNQISIEINIPESPEFPDFEVVPCEVPDPQINIPNIIIPCASIESSAPSIIIGGNINLVSNVTITGLDFPVILVSNVTITGPDYPIILVSEITITPNIPSIIIIDPPIPSIIIIENPISLIGVDWGMAPAIGIDWGEQPALNLQVALTQPVQAVRRPTTIDPELIAEFGDDLGALIDDNYVIDYEPVGIPSVIRLEAPSKEDMIIHHDLPEKILLDIPKEFPKNIPILMPEGFGKDIKIIGPEKSLPNEIEITGIQEIKIKHDIPSIIHLEGLPENINVMGIPDFLEVRGMPSTIELLGMEKIPSIIQLMMPENPVVNMVYNGDPIEFKLKIDKSALMQEDEEGKPKGNCFMFVPCNT